MELLSNYVLSNDNSRKNHLYKQLEYYGKNEDVFIAVAFFTNDKIIDYFLKNNCKVHLIVRLNIGTSYTALENLINKKNVFIRYFTSTSFHPKLYIFGNNVAFIGSSNLTQSGIETNQEVNIKVSNDNYKFDEIVSIFNDYWESPDIKVLTLETIKKFEEISLRHKINKIKSDLEKDIKKEIGNNTFSNILREDKKKQSKENIFIDSFLKKYQFFLQKHKILEEIYYDTNIRIENETELPLRIEIDQFLSWIRESKAFSNNYLNTYKKSDEQLKNDIPTLITEFFNVANEQRDGLKGIINHYQEILTNFGNINKIDTITVDALFNTIMLLHSFSSKERYLYEDGHSMLKEKFIQENTDLKIRNTIKYLLYGKESYCERIGKCIYDNQYKLRHFGESAIKEMYGWINQDNVPICNDRTLKSMMWLGFGDLTKNIL